MSAHAAVHSLEALKEFRTALALYGEDTLAALGAIDAEVRRTTLWLQQDRPAFWQEQIKRRREQVAMARAEVFRRKLAKTADHSPAMSEQVEILRRAEASLADAERRLVLLRKWQAAFPRAVLEFQASTRRIKDLAAGDVPRAMGLLGRIIEAVEAYLSLTPPTSAALGEAASTGPPLESIATAALDADERPGEAGAAGAEEASRAEARP